MKIKVSCMDYKWVILVTCFLMEFLCLGLCSSNIGSFVYLGRIMEFIQLSAVHRPQLPWQIQLTSHIS
jgi:hypothetical protein